MEIAAGKCLVKIEREREKKNAFKFEGNRVGSLIGLDNNNKTR